MISAFIAKLMAAKREMSMNLKVNIFFILICFLPIAPSWRLMEMRSAYKYKERGASSVTRSTHEGLRIAL